MRVPYREDLASHPGPEPHGGCGNTMADAWLGGSVGGTLSSEITFLRCRPCRLVGKAISAIALRASYSRTRRSRRTLACVDTSCGIEPSLSPSFLLYPTEFFFILRFFRAFFFINYV